MPGAKLVAWLSVTGTCGWRWGGVGGGHHNRTTFYSPDLATSSAGRLANTLIDITEVAMAAMVGMR